ncbi:MAG: protein kinase [Anaerolineae bacterium]|nr:protein kinase [Anaerolineae bacterium]
MELTADSILHDRYRIIRPLGQGGMGAVYLADDLTLEQPVAVKVNRDPSEGSARQFLREARLLAALRHSGLPRVIDYFILDSQQFLVMDYIPGEDLEQMIQSQGRQPLAIVMDWATQLASAIEYMHGQQPPVIHRDIKPANIKLTPQGKVILVDFGIAKVTDSSQVTATGAMGYTPGYAPPEQYGRARTGPWSDQYALAATLYTLLSGQKPADSVQRVVGQTELTPLHELNPHIPAGVSAAIERALSIKTDERFSSVTSFVCALNSAASGADNAPAPSREVLIAPPAAPDDATQRSAAHAMPAAKPVVKSRSWMLPVIVAAIVLITVVVVGGYSLLRGASKVPQATGAATLVVTAPSETPAIAATPLPSATQVIPSPTDTIVHQLPNTPEPLPTAGLLPVGKERLLAFASDRADGATLQIWVMRVGQRSDGKLEGYDLKQITNSPGDKTDLAWSPDGTRLLYSAPSDIPGNGLDIFMMDIANPDAPPLNLIRLKGDDAEANWSADGKRIAFTNFGRFQEVYAIYSVRPDGSELTRISFDYQERYPNWLPDMRALVYVIMASGHQYLYQRDQNENYATPQPYDSREIFGRMGEVAEPAISPDGAYVAYTRLDGGIRQVYMVEFGSRGGNVFPLTPDTTSDGDPTWSPDSQWIAYTSERGGNPDIFGMSKNGKLQSNLTTAPGRDLMPAWQP